MAIATARMKTLYNMAANELDPTLQDIKNIYGQHAVNKLKHGYVHDCQDCFGFGWWPDECIPMHFSEAEEGWESDPCPTCNQDNAVFEYLVEQKDDKTVRDKVIKKDLLALNDDIDNMLYEFEKRLRCAELLVIQGSKGHLPE